MTATTLGKLNAAESVIKTLIANGIDKLYCLPGVQNDDFFDALVRVGQYCQEHALCDVLTVSGPDSQLEPAGGGSTVTTP